MATRKHSNRPTLAKVAEMAGVAQSTASRVINGYTEDFRIRPEVRQRILEAASVLRYKPNPMVRSIAAKKTNLVAVVGWASPGVNSTALQEAVRVCNKAEKHVCTTFLTPDSPSHDLPPWRVDGALAFQIRQEEDLEDLETREVPYVSINGLNGPTGDSVTFNEHDGMEQAVDHLYQLGHRRIAYTYIERQRHVRRGLRHGAVRARRKAYTDCLEARGLVPLNGADHTDIDHVDFLRTYVQGQDATALIAYDDIMALYLLQACAVAQIKVPEDLSIVTFNDEMPARAATPPLTTVAVPAIEAGRRAGELLLDRLASEEPIEPRRVVLNQRLVVRGSTAEPKKQSDGFIRARRSP